MARTFELIAPVQYVLHQVWCSYETIPDAPKCHETDWNISLGSKGVDWVRSWQKIPMSLRGMNFSINCTNSPYFAPSFMQLRNDPKCNQTLWNTPKHEFRVQWDGSGVLVAKYYNMTSWYELLHSLHQFSMFCNKFHAVTKWSQMHPNTMKGTKTCV